VYVTVQFVERGEVELNSKRGVGLFNYIPFTVAEVVF
jgi:hypothetical protein